MKHWHKGLILAGAVIAAGAAWAAPAAVQAIIDSYAAAGGANFSADAGKALFQANHTGGNVDTPSCTTCHTTDPKKVGHTRAGKEIAPMASSLSPDRFTDPAKVEKWFRRNCTEVLGRECSPAEKADFIQFLAEVK